MERKHSTKKQRSIKWKVFQYLIGFCLLLLVILWLFQTVLLDDFYKYIKLRELQQDAITYEGYLHSGEMEAIAQAVHGKGDVYVELWAKDKTSTLLSSNIPLPPDIPSQYRFEEIDKLWQETAEEGGALTKRFFNKDGGPDRRRRESILHTRLIQQNNEEKLLLVSSNITPVNATVETLRIQLYWISALMLLLATGIALLIAKRVSKPIEQLNNSAKELRRGKAEFRTEGYREITELSETLEDAAKELLKTDKLRQELIANVSHDLRTPLTLITGYGEMIRDLPDENTEENVQVIIEESRRLTSLVNSLLDLSRLQAGVQELCLIPFDLTAETEKIIARFARFCEQEGYIISFLHDGNVTVQADPERIAQVIYNFISNAINHTGPGRKIWVTQAMEFGRVRLSVRDDGDGIAPDKLGDIWERYYKENKVHKRAEIGSGLGLSIVKSILDQHPGVEYGVASQLGQGSTFWFSIPVYEVLIT